MNTAGYEVVSLIAGGIGAAVWLTDRQSPSSRSLGLFLLSMGALFWVSAHAYATSLQLSELPAWMRLLGFLDALAFSAGIAWGLRFTETVGSPGARNFGRFAMRSGQAIIFGYALVMAWMPEVRVRELYGSLQIGQPVGPNALLLAVPWGAALGLIVLAGVRVLRERPDKAEAARILSLLVMMPLFALALAVSDRFGPLLIALGEIAFLVGALRYLNVQGARGAFMAQFLAPQVAQLVRERGLKQAMARQRLTLSVVCCDIRGFTAHAQANSPDEVLRLLRDYYSLVGTATAQFGGTIKDLAGDGALILLGAPLPLEDHAQRALALARYLQAHVRPAVRRQAPHLGLGVGVAIGEVAVGIVGQNARYEYVAVGSAVNLASRLCGHAGDGEIHVAEAVLQAAGESASGRIEPRKVKGFDQPVSVCVVTAPA